MELQNHSLKPMPRFFGDDAYHLGVELEVEAPNADKFTAGLELQNAPSYCYAKRDGSLGQYGWELVLHPISRSMWLRKPAIGVVKNFFKLVGDLRNMGYTSHGNGRCGLHIHVSLKAFGVPEREECRRNIWKLNNRYRRTHLYWFMRLINSRMFGKLSQRELALLKRWSSIGKVSVDNLQVGNVGRYVATNLTDHTVEVRLFRGNIRECRIRKAIEAVIAAVEFSKSLRAKDLERFPQKAIATSEVVLSEQPLTEEFAYWVEAEREKYPNLCSFMEEIGYIKAGNKETQVCA